jgi:hypothetical protein
VKRHAKVAVAALTLLLAIGGGTAFALNGHAPSPSNPFLEGLANPQALAVDQSSGELYVLDVGDSTVKRFDSSGAPSEFSALGSNAIDAAGGGDCAATPADCDQTPQGGFAFDGPSAAQLAIDRSGGPAEGYIYVTNSLNGAVNVFDQTGTYKGRLPNTGGEPCGVAVDPSGNVFVANTGTGRVYRYAPAADPAEASFEGQLQNLSSPCNIAVDSSGNVYLVPHSGGELLRYESSQFFEAAEPVSTQAALFATAVSIDPTTEDLYVDEGNQLAHYDSSGNRIQRFGAAGDPSEPEDELAESRGVAINAATSTVYASDSADGQVSAFVPAILPDATTEAATAVTDTAATLNGTVDPTEGGPEAECEFQWGTEADSYPNTVPCTPAGPYAVATAASAGIAGLEPGTEYHFRVVGSSAEGTNPGADLTFTTAGAPIVSNLSVSDVGTSSAILHATINPAGAATNYRFEYVSLEEFEASGFDDAASAPVPDGTVAPGPAQDVSQEIEGLGQGTAYHYRLTAVSEGGSATSDPRTLTTHVPAGELSLPEGRRWEMVSPRDKEGSDVRTDAGRTRALAGGDKLFFSSLHSFGDAVGTGLTGEFIAERGSDGWHTHSVTPPMKPQSFADLGDIFDPRFVGELSADGTTGVYTSHSPLTGPSNVSEIKNLYLRRDLDQPGTGTFELLTESFQPILAYDEPSELPDPYRAPAQVEPVFAGASTDFDHVAFSSRLNLTDDAPPQNALCLGGLFSQCAPRLYEHTPAGVRLVGKVPVAPATSCGGDDCVPAVRSVARRGSSQDQPDVVSADGSRIYFLVPRGNGVGGGGSIYLREGGSTTHRVNVDEKTSPEPSGSSSRVVLTWITPDGMHAFFTTDEQLLDTDVDPDADIYRYDVGAPEGSHLTLISDGIPGSGSANRFFGASETGEYAYFGSARRLNSDDPFLPANSEYVYMWHGGANKLVGSASAIDQDLNARTHTEPLARVTPDGIKLMFFSRSLDLLTGNVAGFNAGGGFFHEDCSDLPCGRAYVYDATADSGQGQIACASCPPDGTRVFSNAVWAPRIEVGGAVSENHINHPLTDDGRLAFFSVRDPLVPEDTNGRYDVYAYDLSAGKVRLLSSGACACDSWFVDASPDGRDVFFTTRDRLVGWDTDTLMDVYDARVGGGLPEPPSPLPSCQGDACQPPPLGLNDPTPASAAGGGPGNPKPARRCRPRKRGASVHGKKGRCAKKKGAQRGGGKQDKTNRRAGR